MTILSGDIVLLASQRLTLIPMTAVVASLASEIISGEP